MWKKATYDLLMDPQFFRMAPEALRLWLTIVDHLIAHDKSVIKIILDRGTASQGSSLFTGKDQEYELRASALKRLAFVILSSDVDQFFELIPTIQERLVENLRLSQVPTSTPKSSSASAFSLFGCPQTTSSPSGQPSSPNSTK